MRSWKWRSRRGAASRAPWPASSPGFVPAMSRSRGRPLRAAGFGPTCCSTSATSSPSWKRWPRAFRLLRELTPRTTDYLVSRGERLSARLVAAALEAGGTRARFVDAMDLVHTDAHFGQAAPDYARTDRAVQRILSPLLGRGVVPVVPGFIGATPEGEVATLGRGGSDLTATLLARGLGAARVSLWKDVPVSSPPTRGWCRMPGSFPSSTPGRPPSSPTTAPRSSTPRALIPVTGRRIPVFVRPFADPDAAGTEVSERVGAGRNPVKALTAAGGQALVTVTGNGMLGVPGIAARTFAALHGRRISVSLISQASSEHSICFSVPEPFEDARERRWSASSATRSPGEIDGVEVSPGMATIAVVGLGMHGTPGIAAGVFSALAAGGINVVAIAQGSSELNISFVVVGATQAAEAQRRIHAAFQLSRSRGLGDPARADGDRPARLRADRAHAGRS